MEIPTLISSLLLLYLNLVQSVSAQKVHYVMPNGSSQLCPGQLCLTLDQCTQQAGECFTTGSTVVFMAGNHSLLTSVGLTNVSDLTLRSYAGESADVNIICRNEVTISLDRVTNVTIKGLHFYFCAISRHLRAALFVLTVSSSKVIILNTIFQGCGNASKTPLGAIHAVHSNIEIINSTFRGSGALNVAGSNIVISGSSFMGNKFFLQFLLIKAH